MSRTNLDKKENKALLRQQHFLQQRIQNISAKASPSTSRITRSLSSNQPGANLDGITLPMNGFYHNRIKKAREKIDKQKTRRTRGGTTRPEAVSPPPANNWVPIGPSGLRKGQAATQPITSGRTPGIAVNASGSRVYIGTANGGVWRSEDTGDNWTSLMDDFDLNPVNSTQSDSLACGAIAVQFGTATANDIIYVGSGEAHFGIGSFFGVGPIVSTDGGTNWNVEPVSPASNSLSGSGFYELAIDPNNMSRVIGATLSGVYRRESDGASGFHWDRKNLPGSTTSRVTSIVVASQASITTFYVVTRNRRVYQSTDGDSWTQLGNRLPGSSGRTTLAVDPSNPSIIYAFRQNGSVQRYDTADGNWRSISGIPAASNLVSSQGWYDLAITVEPGNSNRIFLGGSTVASGGEWSGALYRCDITVNSTGGSITSITAVSTYIGASCHADIHALVFPPGDNSQLWVGCDGGVFHTTNPTGTGNIFDAKNTGLQTLSMNHLNQHPSEDAVVFCGTQDNGGERYTGEETWLYSAGGDCGYFVVNWNDPYKIINTYTNASLRVSTDGGERYSYSSANVPISSSEQVLFYAPLAGTPPNPSSPADAETIAFGSIRPWISDDFGTTWSSVPNNSLAQDSLIDVVRSISFFNKDMFYVGTNSGSGVYRFTRSSGNWTRTRIDSVGGTNILTLGAPVTDIAIDPADNTGNSIYVTLGGFGDYRHVWHFNGSQWSQRSGPSATSATSLLDVQHNAIVVDPNNPSTIYVGADIGIWRSTNGGTNWSSFSEGLPDAGVMDLRLHSNRLLRASTHGRGVWERSIDLTVVQGIELYIRDTQLDLGRRTTVNYLDDPTNQGASVRHWRGPNIKVDSPDSTGNYQFPLTSNIDFIDFVDKLQDESSNFEAATTMNVTSKVYVQIHNRGVIPADGVRVMCLLANASAGLPPLPTNYHLNVQNGTAINTTNWTTLGFQTLDNVKVGFPKIAAFDLPSSALPPPSGLPANRHHCVLALIHHPNDTYSSTNTNTDANSRSDRKSAHKNLTVVPYTGPAPLMIPIKFYNAFNKTLPFKIVINQRKIKTKGNLILANRKVLLDDNRVLKINRKISLLVDGMFRQNFKVLEILQKSKVKIKKKWKTQFKKDALKFKKHQVQIPFKDSSKKLATVKISKGSYEPGIIMIEPPKNTKVGSSFELDVLQYDSSGRKVVGGHTLVIKKVKKKKELKYNLKVKVSRLKFKMNVRAKLYDHNGKDLSQLKSIKMKMTKIHLNGDKSKKIDLSYHKSWKSFYAFLGFNFLIGYKLKIDCYRNGKLIATTKF